MNKTVESKTEHSDTSPSHRQCFSRVSKNLVAAPKNHFHELSVVTAFLFSKHPHLGAILLLSPEQRISLRRFFQSPAYAVYTASIQDVRYRKLASHRVPYVLYRATSCIIVAIVRNWQQIEGQSRVCFVWRSTVQQPAISASRSVIIDPFCCLVCWIALMQQLLIDPLPRNASLGRSRLA